MAKTRKKKFPPKKDKTHIMRNDLLKRITWGRSEVLIPRHFWALCEKGDGVVT